MLPPAEPFEQHVVAVYYQGCGSVFALSRANAARPHVLRDHIQAVADSEHRTAQIEHLIGDIRRILLVETGRSAGKNYPARIHRADFFGRQVERMDFAIHAGLAHAARNQLRVLAAEIEDQDHRLRSTIAITEITLTLKYTGPGAAYETPSRRCSTTLRPRRFDARCGPVAALAARPCRRTALHPRAASAPKIEPERRADKFQRLSKSGFDEAYIMRRDAVFDVGEESKTRRCAADLRHVHQVQAPPIHLRRIHRCRRFGQRSIQPRSLKDCAPRI